MFTVLSSFYKYMVQENPVESNPVALIKQKSKSICKDKFTYGMTYQHTSMGLSFRESITNGSKNFRRK
jgi:site-specific recombinase XerD